MKIKYYLNFKEENRLSMDEFAQQLLSYQTENYKEHEISYFLPKLPIKTRKIFFIPIAN